MKNVAVGNQLTVQFFWRKLHVRARLSGEGKAALPALGKLHKRQRGEIAPVHQKSVGIDAGFFQRVREKRRP